jgi:hypothetical protein
MELAGLGPATFCVRLPRTNAHRILLGYVTPVNASRSRSISSVW